MNSIVIEIPALRDIPKIKEISGVCRLTNWSETGYTDLLKDRSTVFLVAKSSGLTVGFILTQYIEAEKAVEILNIAVLPDFRRLGIAASLLAYAAAIKAEHEIEKIWLEVRRSNFGARQFYENMGFTVVGERRNYYTDPPEDAILMSKLMRSA
jgi:ribosomal-protein-alanine N-acetyltransferase